MKKSKVKSQKSKVNSGLTLIELMVVVAIVALITALIMGNILILPRIRDAQRKTDLHKIQHALEEYKSLEEAYPPPYDSRFSTSCGFKLSSGFPEKVILGKFPCDPNNPNYWNGGLYYIWLNSMSTRYVIAACLENPKESGPNVFTSIPVTGAPGGCPSGKYYVLRSQ